MSLREEGQACNRTRRTRSHRPWTGHASTPESNARRAVMPFRGNGEAGWGSLGRESDGCASCEAPIKGSARTCKTGGSGRA